MPYDIIADFDEGIPNPELIDDAVILFRANSHTLMQSRTPGHYWVVFHFKYPVPRDVIISLLEFVECDPHYIELVAARGPSIRISDRWMRVRYGEKEKGELNGETTTGEISKN